MTRGQTRNLGKDLLGSLLHLGEQEQVKVPLLTSQEGSNWFLTWGEGRGVSRVQVGGMA